MQKVEVVVVGAGMVGLALAKTLNQHGFQVALVEKYAVDIDYSTASLPLRVSAISPASQYLLESLKVWSDIESEAAPYEKMFVWDAGTEASITLSAEDVDRAHLGHIVANRAIQKNLYQAIQQTEIQCFIPDHIVDLQAHTNGWQLTLSSGKVLDTALLIGADGAFSALRQQVGIAAPMTFYQQKAIVAVIETELPHHSIAWQRFLPTGPLAFLPLANPHHCSIVWSIDESYVQEIEALEADEFCQQLADALQNKLGHLRLLTERAIFPLKYHHCKTYVKPHFALVGDAAHSIHPLAGQGVNIGLLDVLALSQVLLEAKERQRPLGLLSDLKRYQNQRKWHNETLLRSMTLFNALFKRTDWMTQECRQFGVNQVDRCHWLRKCFIDQAMGKPFWKQSR